MAVEGPPFKVQAVYSFKATNNDELSFKKGDTLTVTQVDDGGWWEGTLGESTGWFPANYVRQCSDPEPVVSTSLPRDQQQIYRNVVLRDIIDSETAHLGELMALVATFLEPLDKARVLTPGDYKQLVGNMEEVVASHRQLLAILEEHNNMPAKEQRIGGTFMSLAPGLRATHISYCSNHPRAVSVLEQHKDELNGFMESQGAHTPGIMVLTTGLSKPFRRLDKYPGMLQEYERHLEESHADRGDTQRSVHVYKEIASACSTVRRQKELELEVVTGTIRGWEGEDLSSLGELIHMGSVAIGSDHRDRYFVLFPSTLVMLSVSSRMSGFIYEGKLPLSGITVNKLDDTELYKNAFDVAGSMIERIVAVCQTRVDQQQWVDLLKQQIRHARQSAVLPSKPQPIPAPNAPPPPPHHNLVSHTNGPHVGSAATRYPSRPKNQVWSLSCLRPSPPLRPCLSLNRDDTTRRSNRSLPPHNSVPRKREEKPYEDDVLILRVIEAYCTSAKTRYTVNSALLDSPQVLIAEEEKIIVEETRGSQTVMEERSLVDTVYALKDSVRELRRELTEMAGGLDEERRWRKKMAQSLRQQLPDLVWDD